MRNTIIIPERDITSVRTLNCSLNASEIFLLLPAIELHKGTYLDPIALDSFLNIEVSNDFTGIPIVGDEYGEVTFILNNRSQNTSIGLVNMELKYVSIQNRIGQELDAMEEENWKKYFKWGDSDKHICLAPNGILYIGCEDGSKCSIGIAEGNNETIVCYTFVIKITTANEKSSDHMFYGKIDPFAQVRTNSGRR